MSVGDPAETTSTHLRTGRLRVLRENPSPFSRVQWSGLPADASRVARALAVLASALLGAVLPVLMVVANKAAPATLGAAALVATLAAVLGGRGRLLRDRYRHLFATPAALLTIAIVVLLASSFAWTIDTGLTRRGLVEGLPELVFALGAAAAWPLVAGPRDEIWLIGGIAAAGLLILFEHETGMPLHALARARGEAWDLKRSAVPPLLLLWPALALCWSERRFRTAAVLVGTVATGVVASHSGAPAAALGCGLALFGLALAARRPALALTGVGLAILIVTAPWTGSVMSRLLPADAPEVLRDEHAEHRLTIWNAFEKRGLDRPLLGHGFNASYKVAASPRPHGRAAPADSGEILDFHPHDIMLQFWVELGSLGLMASAVVFAFIMRRLMRRRGIALAARLGLLMSVIGVGIVGLSAWQPWYLASTAAALLWFDFVDRQHPDGSGYSPAD